MFLIYRRDRKQVLTFDKVEEIASVFVNDKEYPGLVLGLNELN